MLGTILIEVGYKPDVTDPVGRGVEADIHHLHLGKVKRFENREISGEAVVEPVVDFESLDHVFVIEMQKAEPAPAAEAIQKAEPVNGGSGGKGKGKGRK